MRVLAAIAVGLFLWASLNGDFASDLAGVAGTLLFLGIILALWIDDTRIIGIAASMLFLIGLAMIFSGVAPVALLMLLICMAIYLAVAGTRRHHHRRHRSWWQR